ncbi:hypothetical protein EON65_44245 [archaeon]|nr:MAG: hypothetical protein EON65_44245 [archaeon]
MESIPSVNLVQVASYFGSYELYRSAMVCQQWKKEIFEREDLWKDLIDRLGLSVHVGLISNRRFRRDKTLPQILHKFMCIECNSLDNGLIFLDLNSGGSNSSSLVSVCLPCFKSVCSVDTWKIRIRVCLPRAKRKLSHHCFLTLVDKIPYPAEIDKKAKKSRKSEIDYDEACQNKKLMRTLFSKQA